MKIKKIISLIESLNEKELSFLVKFLSEAPWPENDPESKKLKNAAEAIVTKSIDPSDIDDKVLKLKDKKGTSIAHWLAYYSKEIDFDWDTIDEEILKMKGYDDRSVAHILAYYHPTWTTDKEELLNLVDVHGITVRDILEDKGKI